VTSAELGHRQMASFLALSMGLHILALLGPRLERADAPLPETPVLVFEIVETAPETVAPAKPEPPAPSPPSAKQPPSLPVPPERTAAPKKTVALPKKPPIAKAAPMPKPTPETVATPMPARKPVASVTSAPKSATVAKARYEDLLYNWLVRHKEYPVVASRRGIEGRPVVTVRIDREGRVVSSRVSSPSRYSMLDEAAVAMVRRADPFPPVPEEVAGDSYEFIAPVEYRLR
jgi:protein TonB